MLALCCLIQQKAGNLGNKPMRFSWKRLSNGLISLPGAEVHLLGYYSGAKFRSYFISSSFAESMPIQHIELEAIQLSMPILFGKSVS